MEFKLNLHPPGQAQNVQTGAVLDRAIALRDAAQARYGARAASAFSAAKARAREAGRTNIARVRAFKARWDGWLQGQNTNFWLLISNVLYIAASLSALILALLVMNEHVDDFRRNEYTAHKTGDDGKPIAYRPCGMPTPDSMYLLQAIGALPAAGLDGAVLEPDYKNWMQRVDRALCSRLIPDVDPPAYYADDAQCEDQGLDNDYGVEHAEELLAIGYLMDDSSVTPTGEDKNNPSQLEAKHDLFEQRLCLDKRVPATATTPAKELFYPKQQREAYGDLKTRVARAYLAAMPAFSRYNQERQFCQAGEAFTDPFDEKCKHSCHIRKELKDAAGDQHIMYDSAQADLPSETTFTKQLYRLLALSLAGYYDRYHNQGRCFLNPVQDDGERMEAVEFCQDSMAVNAVGATTAKTNEQAVAAYSTQNTVIAVQRQCGVANLHPPPPAPPIHRNNADDSGDKLSAQVCAATLQYGLFEQGRLFGIPDIFGPFVVDNRVDRGLHFIAKWIYDAMYNTPVKKAGDVLIDPKSKLEMYIAYRLSSTSIWVILVANVAGYMFVRSVAPTVVYVLKLIGVRSNVKQPWAGRTAEYEPIVLVRPQMGWPIYLAMFVNLLVIYWIFWIDPATQSHYYITTECDDWAGLGVQVPSGAYVTNWGKRRFGRFGEHVIGILLVLMFVFVLFQAFIGKAMVDPALVRKASTASVGTTKRLDKVALIMIGFALVVQILFIAQSWVSGDNWYQAIKASDNSHAMLTTFSKDVLMSVWAAFWTSASISFYRQKWAVDNLPNFFQYTWMAAALVLLWMPVFHSATYLSNEIDVAFTNGKGTEDTPRLIIYIMIYAFSGIWTAVLGIRLHAMWKAMPSASGAHGRTSAAVSEAKAQANALIAEAERAKAEEERLAMYNFITSAPASKLTFDLQGMQVSAASVPVHPQRKTDPVYMPLMPR